ncbi:hypothetical protein V9T40_014089 [Parthenolecanium corni]|uniref:Uncharacterized protein n=1 Tax=Parthenolecanium corni TaxID=536013 RepID=A0AAN9TT96_9HEMI
MCWTFLKDEEYKFEITLLKDDDAFNIECTDRKLQLKIFDQKQLKTGVLKMFRCPSIAESIFLKRAPIYYMMCDFQLKSKAIVFIQEDEHSPLYPYKYLDEIEYDSFEAIYIRMLDKRPPLQPHEYHWLQLYQKQSNDLIQHIQDESAKLESAVRQITDSIKIRSREYLSRR